ncbi:MAG: hypothetical protein KBD48_03970 [Candidatus Pacebacteria bacterium]|nr:hypothetical protein [Candidatus Paceibacterota bacterium]MBP9716311.1 hypothetical protein [Candidatus Paceibacterota bacterium]
MLNWFKKYFIPHEGNDHRPRILDRDAVRNILILVILFEGFVFLGPTLSQINKTGGMAAVLPAVLGELTNEERKADHLLALNVNPVLNKAAQMKAQDMAEKGYFAHTSPEGLTPWYWLKQVDYKYQYAGENLAINFTDSKDVTDAWMNSPTHKANIIKNNYTEVGTGVATGVYEGKETLFVAQVYASPLREDTKSTPDNTKDIDKVNKEEILNDEMVPGSNVLGIETETIKKAPVVEEKTIAVSETKIQESVKYDVLNEKPTLVQKIIASPRHSTNTVIYIIFGIVLLSLILNIFIKIKHHHPDLIMNGLITIVVIGAVLVVNYYVTHKEMKVIQSVDYSNVGE